MQCVVTGKKCNSYLSNEGKLQVNFDELCQSIIDYQIGGGNNLWDKLIRELKPADFSNTVIDNITKDKDEYTRAKWCLKSISKNYVGVGKNYRSQVYSYSKVLLASNRTTELEKSRIYGLLLIAYLSDYEYKKAEVTANLLKECSEKLDLAYCALANYYTYTRRYDLSSEVLDEAKKNYPASQVFNKYIVDNNKRKRCADEGTIGEYMPCPRENRQEVQQRYNEFLLSLHIDTTNQPKKHKTYDSYVCYDFETSGLNSISDSPIEIGAIKVIDGKIIESKEFTFRELMKPRSGSIDSFITSLTGITNDDLKDARSMKEVMTDFFNWIGDLPLIGYNSRNFDDHFLQRCAEECNYPNKNRKSDVYWLAKSKHFPTTDNKLNTVANYLQLSNPRAHRALYDAITTAKIYEKIK